MTRDEYIRSLFVKQEEMLEDVLESIQNQGMPMISVSPASGKLLTLLVAISGAKQVLEIGALGGYSGICLVRGLGAEGRLTSLELRQEYADVAFSNLKKAGYGDKVAYYVGEALHSLAKLEEEQKRFDFFFIDADKDNYINYLESAVRLANPGALIVADNVLWQDRVLNIEDQDPSTSTIRAFNEWVANDERLESILIPIGDGLTLARVK